MLSIFNTLSPNCHCGAVLQLECTQYNQIKEGLNEKPRDKPRCGRCHKLVGYSYFECPAIDTIKHCNAYKICEQCTFQNISIYQENDGNLFEPNSYYQPEPRQARSSFDATKSFSTLKTQRRVCLAFTEDYVRVYLHCFSNPATRNHDDFCKALYTNNFEWRSKKSDYALNETQIGILMDDFTNWEQRGKYWTDFMEYWTGGNIDSIFTALCHCNQINHKITNDQRDKIENYLYNKQTKKHGNIHDKGNNVKQKKGLTKNINIFDENELKNMSRKPWTNLSPKLFECSITENDAITAVLDIVGGFLSNLDDQQKLQLTYRGKFNRSKK